MGDKSRPSCCANKTIHKIATLWNQAKVCVLGPWGQIASGLSLTEVASPKGGVSWIYVFVFTELGHAGRVVYF